jgi:hypothetical protein
MDQLIREHHNCKSQRVSRWFDPRLNSAGRYVAEDRELACSRKFSFSATES